MKEYLKAIQDAANHGSENEQWGAGLHGPDMWYDESNCWMVRRHPITGAVSIFKLPPISRQIWCELKRWCRWFFMDRP